jgi:SET domain-containing protein
MGLSFRGMVEVRPCPHGRGLFACADIEVGRVIQEFEDLAMVASPAHLLEAGYAMRIGEHEYWDGFPSGSADYWSNFIDHSYNPNAVFVFDDEKRRAWLKAVAPIQKGQEVFINYKSYFPTNPAF